MEISGVEGTFGTNSVFCIMPQVPINGSQGKKESGIGKYNNIIRLYYYNKFKLFIS